MNYKEGDRIQLTGEYTPYKTEKGYQGTILVVDPRDNTLRIHFDKEIYPKDGSHRCWVDKKDTVPIEFKVGDTIRCLNEEELEQIGDIPYQTIEGELTFRQVTKNMLEAHPALGAPFSIESLIMIKPTDYSVCPKGFEEGFCSLLFRHTIVNDKPKYRTTYDGFSTCDENWEPGKWLL